MGDVSPRAFYDRQLRVPGWGDVGQERLRRACVLVVGVGGLGCPALMAMARAGVGKLVFCDSDRVETSNLPRQNLFGVADVGRPKVEAAASALALANPWISLQPHSLRVTASNVRGLVEAADLVIDGSDNFTTKFLLHDACRSAAKPLVMAALYQWEAQVTAFDFRLEGEGCWRCLYKDPPDDTCANVCADVGVAGALAGLAGNYQALIATRLLLNLTGPSPRTTWVLSGADAPQALRWSTDPDCSCARGSGDWSWLGQTSDPQVTLEAWWDDVAPEARQTVLDLRDETEIVPGEWEWFEAQGSAVIHAPWSRWHDRQPIWTSTTYLLVCARGSRSLAAMRRLPPGVRAVSLRGGVAALTAKIGRLSSGPNVAEPTAGPFPGS